MFISTEHVLIRNHSFVRIRKSITISWTSFFNMNINPQAVVAVCAAGRFCQQDPRYSSISNSSHKCMNCGVPDSRTGTIHCTLMCGKLWDDVEELVLEEHLSVHGRENSLLSSSTTTICYMCLHKRCSKHDLIAALSPEYHIGFVPLLWCLW